MWRLAVVPAVLAALMMPGAATAQEAAPEVAVREDCPAIDPPPQDAPDPADTPPQTKPGLGARFYSALRREVRRYGSDSASLVKAPLTWNSTEWKTLAGATVIVGGLMFADKSIDRAAQKASSRVTTNISKASAPLGSQYGFALSGSLWVGGTLLNHENMRETGRDAVEAGVLAYVLDTVVLKRLFGRERPRESGGRTVFVPGSSHDSFPSGHATEAFAVASVISARSKSWPIPVIAYSLATLVAADRINTRDHFASDVVAGAFLGSAVGHFLVNRHGEEEKGVLSKAVANLEIVPIRHGLAAQLRF